MRVLFATNNRHKLGELQAILHGIDVISLTDAGVTLDADETGTTFLDNAMIKARATWAQAIRAPDNGSLVVVADDSGLCVDALGGRPGVYSARYGNQDGAERELTAAERNKLLLGELGDTTTRTAHFVCCMVAILDENRIVTSEERWRGEIARAQVQTGGGFGYDPVFYLPSLNCTAAELAPDEKNRLSHRGRAARVLRAALDAAESLDSGNLTVHP